MPILWYVSLLKQLLVMDREPVIQKRNVDFGVAGNG